VSEAEPEPKIENTSAGAFNDPVEVFSRIVKPLPGYFSLLQAG
jgi:hypothetical protein